MLGHRQPMPYQLCAFGQYEPSVCIHKNTKYSLRLVWDSAYIW